MSHFASKLIREEDGTSFHYSEGFNLISRGLNDEFIETQLSATRKSIERLKAAYIALFENGYRTIFPEKRLEATCLVDECLSPRAAYSIGKEGFLGRHIIHLGKENATDREVFTFSVEQNYDFILTRDLRERRNDEPSKSEELTIVALAHALEVLKCEDESRPETGRFRHDMPLLIRFTHCGGKARNIANYLSQYKQELLLLKEKQEHVYVTITREGLRLGPTYEELKKIYPDYEKRIAFDNSNARVDKYAKKWLQRIMANHRGKKIKGKNKRRLMSHLKDKAMICIAA